MAAAALDGRQARGGRRQHQAGVADLQDAANAGDVKATQATLDQLETLLTDIEGGQRYAVSETSRDLAATGGPLLD